MEYELSELEELEQIYIELHKDVYGVKARWYKAESVEQARKDVDALQAAGEKIWAEEREAEQRRVVDFENRVSTLITMGAGSREDAIKWLHDAHSTNGDNDFLCYELGLPYGYLSKV